ncbi:hypothetical protein [Megalodesulfovibrio paquesii]
MGIFARTMEVSKYAQCIYTMLENSPGHPILGPEDLPQTPPPFRPLLDKAADISADIEASGEAKYSDAAFAARHAADIPVISETVVNPRPEATDGTLVQLRT